MSFTSGAVITTGLHMDMHYREAQVDPSAPSFIVEKDEEHFGNMAIGFHSGAALTYRFYKGFYTALEVGSNFQSWKPKEGELVRYEVNGDDQLPSATYAYTHFVFMDEIPTPPMPGPDEPSRRLAPVYSLSGIAFKLSVGVELRFATKSGKQI